MRSVDVVVAGDARDQAEVLPEVAGHPLAEELLPPVAILGHRGVCVAFAEWNDVRIGLLVRGVDTCRRGIEIALDAGLAGGHQQVRVDQDREHAVSLVRLDEAHPAHVGGEVVDDPRAVDRLLGGFAEGQVKALVLGAVEALVPVVEGLDIDRPNLLALTQEVRDEVASDETAGAGDDHRPTQAD